MRSMNEDTTVTEHKTKGYPVIPLRQCFSSLRLSLSPSLADGGQSVFFSGARPWVADSCQKQRLFFGSVWFSFGSVWFYLLCSYKKCINILWFSNYRSVVQCFLTRESKCSFLEFWNITPVRKIVFSWLGTNRTPVKENCIFMTWNQRFTRILFFLFCGLKTKVLFSIFQHFLIQTEPKQTKRSQNWRVADSCQNKRF